MVDTSHTAAVHGRDPRVTRERVSPAVSALTLAIIMSDRELLSRGLLLSYICGGLIVRSAVGPEIEEATSAHFMKNWAFFEVPE